MSHSVGVETARIEMLPSKEWAKQVNALPKEIKEAVRANLRTIWELSRAAKRGS